MYSIISMTKKDQQTKSDTIQEIEKKRLYNKEYKQKNKERIREQSKQYHEHNKERRNEMTKKYYEDNKETINKKIVCVCGSEYMYKHKARHETTQKHLDYIKHSIDN